MRRSSRTATPIRRNRSTTPAASALSPPSTASRGARSCSRAIEALKSVWHRGAVDADGKTGDGAGIHLQVPQDFFRAQVEQAGHALRSGRIAVGQIFLPRTDYAAQETCRTIVESEILRVGFHLYGWRQVPIDISIIGEKANATRPEIEQIMFDAGDALDLETLDRRLYLCRRRIEKRVREAVDRRTSMSARCRRARSIYKGMFLAEQLSNFYPDLKDERFVSRVRDLPPALFDQHLPDMAAGPALPHARAQWRDQHAEGQRQLDEEPRVQDGVGTVRRRRRRHQAHHPAGRIGFRRARRRVRGAGARRPHGAARQDACSFPKHGRKRPRPCRSCIARCTPMPTR